jgi:hypothetical protein
MRSNRITVAVVCLLASSALLSVSLRAQAARGAGNPQALLNRASEAILKLKSAQFTLNREGAPAVLDEKNGITFTAAQCMYAAPDRVSCNVKVSSRNGTVLQITRVWVPEGAFQSNPLTRQFGPVPADSAFNGVVLFAKTGIPEVMQKYVEKLQAAGTEKIRDKNATHLKGEARGDKLNPLMGNTLKPDVMYPVDLWMEDTTANPLRIHVTEPPGNGWMIDIFAVNEPVEVPTPQVPPPAGRQ